MIKDPSKVQRAQQCALFFRRQGWNALPSRSDRKGPALVSFAEYWAAPLPNAVYDHWDAENVQVMTGAHWGLVVVDCDGEAAHLVWQEMLKHHQPQDQWVCLAPWIARTGGGGYHYWFRLGPETTDCPSRRLWGLWDTWAGPKHEGDWRKHHEIRLLADHALVIAPPSTHVETGKPYEWVAGCSPREQPRLGLAPPWLLTLPAATVARLPPPPSPAIPIRRPTRLTGASWDRDVVLEAIPDKVALAQSWGLRIASRKANGAGWISCHAIDRPDRTASASIHEASGTYHEQREGVTLTLFDLGVALGRFANWQECKNALGDEFLAYAGPRV